MTAKAWLEEVRHVDDEVAVLRRSMFDAYAMATSATSRLSEAKAQTSPDPHKFDRIAILDEAIYDRIAELSAMKAKAVKVISSLEDPRQRQVLLAYYVDSRTSDGVKKTWEMVCVELSYSWSRLHEIRSAAIAALDEKADRSGYALRDMV